MGHIMQRIFPLMIVSVALLALPATAMPFWTGRRIAGTVARHYLALDFSE